MGVSFILGIVTLITINERPLVARHHCQSKRDIMPCSVDSLDGGAIDVPMELNFCFFIPTN